MSLENPGTPFMRIDVYVREIGPDGLQDISFIPARFADDSAPLLNFAKKCTAAIKETMKDRSMEERLELRKELKKFLLSQKVE